MATDVQVINLGLAKIAASRINSISPGSTSLERHCATGYSHWKRSELGKRRWLFATVRRYKMGQLEELEGDDKYQYKYNLPADCIRPIREKHSEWTQYGKQLYSNDDNLYIDYIRNVPESDWDDLFVEVMAARVALECTEQVTQSNTKKADNSALYRDAINQAANVNAFIRGPEDIQADDSDFTWVTARY